VSARFLFLLLSLFPAVLTVATSPLAGTWELIDATPVPPGEIDPHGFMNHKTRYTADGLIYMIPADQKLDETAFARYTFDGHTRTIVVPGHEPVRNPLSIRGDVMTLTFDTGRKLTYRRMQGDRPWDRILEPVSLEVIRTERSLPIPRPAYDRGDYSKTPLPQRMRGVWEIASYSDVRYPIPPHGLPNDKYVFTASRVSLVPPDQAMGDRQAESPYRFSGANTILVDGETWTISFDRWQRMVIRREQDEITLRLVQKATSPIPRLPVTVALLPEE
jgi:hypothetical protein